MTYPANQVKPTPKLALPGPYGLAVSTVIVTAMLAAYFGLLGEYSALVFFGIPAMAAVVAAFRALLIEREPPPVDGRRLELSDGRLRQYDGGHVIAEIDVTRPFEYKILDRYDVAKALFRLYQEDNELSFYFSDPGGKETVKSVFQIAWPPRSRHAGRSYPPSAAYQGIGADRPPASGPAGRTSRMATRCGVDTAGGRRVGRGRLTGGWHLNAQCVRRR